MLLSGQLLIQACGSKVQSVFRSDSEQHLPSNSPVTVYQYPAGRFMKHRTDTSADTCECENSLVFFLFF